MSEKTLATSFAECEYFIKGHGTRSTAQLQEALAAAGPQSADLYGSGALIEDFQNKMAKVLGKEQAIFFPTGTMAQQIALRIWSDRQGTKRVAYHPLAHLEIHEEDGLRALHQLEPQLLGEPQRLFTLADLQALKERPACVLIELPQREIGGQLPNRRQLRLISEYCRRNQIKVHLDGARLWECLDYYDTDAAEICALFDSVYVSFYKGIGAVAGAILAGDEAFMAEAKCWKRRHGGDIVSLYPYTLAADYFYEQRIDKMADYHGASFLVAAHFKNLGFEVVPDLPQTNMFHVHLPVTPAEGAAFLQEIQETTKVGFSGSVMEDQQGNGYFEVSIGDGLFDMPDAKRAEAFRMLREKGTLLKRRD